MPRIPAAALLALVSTLLTAPALAEERGRGDTAATEVQYLKFIVDHHYSALRMTELAAGTDRDRSQDISAREGTAPSPGFDETQAKATLDEIKSLARRENRTQREEILTAQGMLRDWYGIEYRPRVRECARTRCPRSACSNGRCRAARSTGHSCAPSRCTTTMRSNGPRSASPDDHWSISRCAATAKAASMPRPCRSRRCTSCCASPTTTATSSRRPLDEVRMTQVIGQPL